MVFLTKQFGKYPIGIWMALIGLGVSFLAWLMQGYSLLDWEGAIKLGLQSDSFNGSEVSKALAKVERGIALADVFWPLPLSVIALIGVLKRKLYGFVSANMVFAICVYFPMFFAFQRWNSELETVIAAIILFAIPSLLGIIGLWSNRRVFN